MNITTYQDLKVWQFGIALAKQVYQLTHQFPKHELYGLAGQMQRAAVSISSNIAEGSGRNSTKEYINFLSIALGSSYELETQAILAKELMYISQEELETILSKTNEISRMLRGLQRSLKAKL